MKNKGDKTMKKVLLTSAAVVAAAAALNAAPVHAYGNWSGWDGSAGNPTHHDGVVAPANQYKPAKPVTNPRGSNDNGYGTPTHTQGTVTVTIIDLSTGKPVAGATVDFNAGGKVSSVTTDANGVAKLADVKPGTAVAYRLTVPAGYAEDSYNGHVTAVAGDVPATFSIRPATVQNNRRTLHPENPGQSYGEPAAQTTQAKAEWIKSGSRWWYKHADGSYTTNGWEKINGTWYYFDQDGWMVTGWVKDNGTWYYLKSSGAMATGWYQVGTKWYYSYSSGALAVSTTTPDGYTVNENGEWV